MISVPYEVKKALRDGMLRKNYRFKVFGLPSSEYVDVVTGWNGGGSEANGLTLTNPGKYKVYSSSPYFTLMFRSGTSYGGIMARDRDPVTGDFYVEHEFTYAPSKIWITYTSASYNVEMFATYDYTIIDNNTLVSESISIDERMCSGDALKFGLCEGSSIEFQYFDHPNITGKQIQAFVDVEYDPDEDFYPISMGFFEVKKCSRQASTGIIKATAYNKLMSDYLDAKANQEIIDIVSEGEEGNSTVSFYWILDKLLKDYSIEKYETSTTYPDITDAELETDIGLETWRQAHGGGVREICFPLFTGSGNYTGQYIHICSFSLAMGGFQGETPAYYDKFRFNGEVAKNITTGVYQLGNPTLNNYYVSSYETPATYMSLRDFLLNGGWSTMRALANVTYSFEDQKRLVGGEIEKGGSYLAGLQSDYTTGIHYISIDSNVRLDLPYYAVVTNSSANVSSVADYKTYFKPLHISFGWIYKELELNIPEAAMQRITLEQAEKFGDITLRDLQSAVYETVCQFGQLDRVTDLFSGVELNNGGLYPAEDLYPADDLYPSGASLSATKAMYSQLWADEGNKRKWRYLIITYKGLDGDNNEADFTLQRTVNADGTDDYNMSDNWLFRNLIWTAEEIGDYADAMVTKMQNNEWFPFEMWCAGLPYLETGDQIEIPLNGEVYKSYILQRQLKGIQNLQDTYVNGTLDIF